MRSATCSATRRDFTVDGVDYGPGRQPGGNIMNSPANPPVTSPLPAHSVYRRQVARYQSLVERRIDQTGNVPCSYI